jgi:hypothetical protein
MSSNPAVKRLAAELRELHRNPPTNFVAEPLEVCRRALAMRRQQRGHLCSLHPAPAICCLLGWAGPGPPLWLPPLLLPAYPCPLRPPGPHAWLRPAS